MTLFDLYESGGRGHGLSEGPWSRVPTPTRGGPLWVGGHGRRGVLSTTYSYLQNHASYGYIPVTPGRTTRKLPFGHTHITFLLRPDGGSVVPTRHPRPTLGPSSLPRVPFDRSTPTVGTGGTGWKFGVPGHAVTRNWDGCVSTPQTLSFPPQRFRSYSKDRNRCKVSVSLFRYRTGKVTVAVQGSPPQTLLKCELSIVSLGSRSRRLRNGGAYLHPTPGGVDGRGHEGPGWGVGGGGS